MTEITVIKPGMLTTVQDAGRIGYQQYGVPVSGVMDDYAYRASNVLVGNKGGEAVLEVTLMGPALRIERETVLAVTGGDLGPLLNGQPMDAWTSVRVQAGDQISFKSVRSGCRSCIAFAGGIDVPLLMGSRSTYTRGKLGGYRGRALKAGDEITLMTPVMPLEALAGRRMEPRLLETRDPVVVRVVPGPQEDSFSPEGVAAFYREIYQVTTECDRMGCRLEGPVISHLAGADIVSDGIAMGAIQVPGHGRPIVMMAD
ncbi:MAG: biotin-dependent carboxyltransferase family protein, partial [Bacillota bacterium]|nr:biotin-dependent carboxyltransferase family protein [Bacillota bacterium]